MRKLFEQQVSALHRSSAVEQSLSSLYGEIALWIPSHATFWQRLSTDEAEHGRSLLLLSGLVEDEKLVLDVTAFNTDAVRSMEMLIGDIRGQILTYPGVSHRRAAVLALALEGALVEQPVFTAIRCESAQFRQITAMLRDSTSAHIVALLDAAANGSDV